MNLLTYLPLQCTWLTASCNQCEVRSFKLVKSRRKIKNTYCIFLLQRNKCSCYMNLQDYEKVCLDINWSPIPCCRLRSSPFLSVKRGEKESAIGHGNNVARRQSIYRAREAIFSPHNSFASHLRGCEKPSSNLSRLRTFVKRTKQQWIRSSSALPTIRLVSLFLISLVFRRKKL